jgi:hypothetical protein
MKLHSLVHFKQDQVTEYIPWNLGYQWNNVDHNLNISLNLLNCFGQVFLQIKVWYM